MREETSEHWPRTRPPEPIGGPLPDAMIGEIYHTALNPDQYERLVDIGLQTLARIDQFGAAQDPQGASRHVAQASSILDSSGPYPEIARLFALYRHLPALLLSASGKVLHANPRATALLAGASDWPSALTTNATLSNVVMRRIPVRYEEAEECCFTVLFDRASQARLSEELAESFDLTQAEREVLRLSLQGLGRKEIAQHRAVSPETVKKQIERILSKTGASTQQELSLMSAAMWRDTTLAPQDLPKMALPVPAALPYFPDEKHLTSEGRLITYRCFGDPQGSPVLFFHGTFGFCRWPLAAEQEAARRGLKVIVPIRPGYGNTSPADDDEVPSRIFEDIRIILNHEGARKVPIVTMENDSFLGFTFAQAYPERVSGLLCFAGVLPVTRKAQYGRMDKWHRFVVGTAYYTPSLIPLVAQGGFHFASRIGRAEFVRQVYAVSPPDLAIMQDPLTRDPILDGTRVTLSPRHLAHQAYAQEMRVFARGAWHQAVEAARMRFRVIFINGTTDPIAPPQTIAEFREDYPWIDFELYENAGQFVFFSHWSRLFARLPELAPQS